jgi:hypothetical protein
MGLEPALVGRQAHDKKFYDPRKTKKPSSEGFYFWGE